MYKIRGLEDYDAEAVREICVLTARNFKDTPRNRSILWDLYCDYYLEYARDTSFVATDDDDKAIGYILCAPDYAEYERNYRKSVLPQLFEHSFLQGLCKSVDLRLGRRLAEGVAAHLHIDIIEDAQRKGVGSRLMDALVLRLKELGASKVYLTVSAHNVKGVNFYAKYGFEQAKMGRHSLLYTLDIRKFYPGTNYNETNK